MMKRRKFIKVVIGTFSACCGAGRVSHGQKLDSRIPRLGVLFAGVPARSPQLKGLWEGLETLGYADGKNIHVDLRAAEGRNERLPSLAADLVDSKSLMSSWELPRPPSGPSRLLPHPFRS